MAFMMDAQKDLRVDIGEYFPYPGPCDRTKASTVLSVGMLYCRIGSDGTIGGCPDQPGRYDEGCLRDRSFEEIWRGGFKRYREWRIVNEDGDVWCVMRGVIMQGDAG